MVHESAATGYRNRAGTYRDARPGYHQALVDRFAARYAEGLVADVGAGTGIFTAQLVDVGVDVVAVEPVAEMRELLAAQLPAVDVLPGTAENLSLGDGAVHTVVAAQSFHWFDHGSALDEIHRVLHPGGVLVTVWNVRDESVSWAAAYNNVQKRYEDDTPRHRSMVWRTAIDSDARFEPVDDWGVENAQPTTVEGVVGRFLSTSFIAALPADEQNQVAREIREIIEPYGPTLEFPYRSELQAWQRT